MQIVRKQLKIVILSFRGASICKKDIFWVKKLSFKNSAIFFIIGVVFAFVAEYWALFIKHEWSYTPHMPTIFGIGFSPLIQLSFTGLISLLIIHSLISIEK